MAGRVRRINEEGRRAREETWLGGEEGEEVTQAQERLIRKGEKSGVCCDDPEPRWIPDRQCVGVKQNVNPDLRWEF